MAPVSISPTTDTLAAQKPSRLAKLGKWIRLFIVLLTPAIFSFILIIPNFHTPKGLKRTEKYAYQLKWIYTVVVTGTYLTTNVIAHSVSSILPFILFPFLGVTDARKLASYFLTSVNMAQLGGLLVVVIIDSSGLMRRWVLLILKKSSGHIGKIYVFLFLASLIFSMFIGCGTAAFLMVKMINGILEEIRMEVASGSMGDERMALVHDVVVVAEDLKGHLPGEDESKTLAPAAEQENSDDIKTEEQTKEPQQEKETFSNDPQPEKKTPSQNPKAPSEKTADTTPIKQKVLKEFVLKFDQENAAYLRCFGGELLYGVAVAANIGGTFLPTSSPVGEDLFMLKYTYSNLNPPNSTTLYQWTVLSWMWYSFPLLIINAGLCLLFLLFLNFSSGPIAKKVRQIMVIDEKRLCMTIQSPLVLTQLQKLFTHKYLEDTGNRLSFPEAATIFFLVAFMILNWLRWPGFMPGWAEHIRGVYTEGYKPIDVGMSALFMMIVILMFVTPKAGWNIFTRRTQAAEKPRGGGLVTWKGVQANFPWSILFILAASRAMGLVSSKTVAEPAAIIIARLGGPKAVGYVLMLFAVLLNFVLPNPGTSLVIQYIWINLVHSSVIGKKNAPLLIPVLSATSLVFMIPASSIPNAVVFRSDKRPSTMYFIKVGFPLLIITLSITMIYGNFIWPLGSFTILYRQPAADK